MAACDGDDGINGLVGANGVDCADGAPGQDRAPGQDGSPGFDAATFLVANNGDTNRNTVSSVDQNANVLTNVTTGANQGVVFTQNSTLVQAGDSDLPLVRSMCNFDAQDGFSARTGHESDVGSAADATDGKLYVIPGASRADGLTNVSVNIAGPNSMLGNPVDLMMSNGHVYVAEKSNGMILRFDNILNSPSGDITATYSAMYPAPESVQVLSIK